MSNANRSNCVSRRDFLSHSQHVAAASAAVSVLSGSVASAAANDKINLALIGCGGIMSYHVGGLVARNSAVRFVHLCDVDPAQINREAIGGKIAGFQKQPPRQTQDYQTVLDDKSVDAVIIATPHHWHAPMVLHALAAGKDIYCEKPLCHTFAEGQRIRQAVKKSGRILQHGSQMRSSPVTKMAGQLLAEGVIGEVRVSKAWNVQDRGTRAIVPDSQPPAGVDYDRWLGPAPVRPFNVNRFHANWRVYRDYGNGDMGDDGIHDIDMARWGLGVTTHPNRITAHGSDLYYAGANKGDREFPDNMNVSFQYDEGKVLIYEDRLFTPYGMHGFDSGNAFYGDDGYMILSRRGYFQTYLGPKEKKGPGVPQAIRGNAGRGYMEHMQNFLACLRSRETPNATADIAHLSCALVHLGEIAYRTENVLHFDPQRETFLDHPAAEKMLAKTYRAPYGLPDA